MTTFYSCAECGGIIGKQKHECSKDLSSKSNRKERLLIETTLKRCPLCPGSATILDEKISCDICLCDLIRLPGQTDLDLSKQWNTRSKEE